MKHKKQVEEDLENFALLVIEKKQKKGNGKLDNILKQLAKNADLFQCIFVNWTLIILTEIIKTIIHQTIKHYVPIAID